MNMDNRRALETNFNNYFPQHNRDGALIREIRKEIKEIEEVLDVEKKWSRVFNSLTNHRNKLNTLTEDLKLLRSWGNNISPVNTIDEYSKQIDKLEKNKSLPLTTQITNLQREIKQLENKVRNQTEEMLLINKKKELEELLRKQNGSNTNEIKPSDKIGLYIGLGIVGIFLILGLFILARTRKRPN